MHEASHGDQISNGKSTFADSNLTTSALQNSLLKEKKERYKINPTNKCKSGKAEKALLPGRSGNEFICQLAVERFAGVVDGHVQIKLPTLQRVAALGLDLEEQRWEGPDG
jgi:hypothetical protein